MTDRNSLALSYAPARLRTALQALNRAICNVAGCPCCGNPVNDMTEARAAITHYVIRKDQEEQHAIAAYNAALQLVETLAPIVRGGGAQRERREIPPGIVRTPE